MQTRTELAQSLQKLERLNTTIAVLEKDNLEFQGQLRRLEQRETSFSLKSPSLAVKNPRTSNQVFL